MQKKTLSITYCAILISIAVVIKLFMNNFIFFPISFMGAEKIIAISLAPAAIMFAGILLGPAYGGIAGALTDIICFTIAPQGAYFPGFTLSMALYGILPALILNRRSKTQSISFYRSLFAGGVSELVSSVILNTLWLYLTLVLLSAEPIPMSIYTKIIWLRLITAGVSWPVYSLIIFMLLKYKSKLINPVLLK